jgi:recombination DNA repair RAD52 pathway protein
MTEIDSTTALTEGAEKFFWNTDDIGPQLSDEQIDALMSSLNPSRVAKRSQGGQSLSYLESYDVKATLIRVFGFGGFSADVIDSHIIQIREFATHPQHVHERDTKFNKKGDPKTPQVIAQATVRLHIPSLGCTYTETAVGHSQQGDIGEACDMALKTAESDALKRAATYLGTQFGLGLYNQGSTAEVVRKIVEPTQAAQLKRVRANRPDPVAQAAGALQNALGATQVQA